jgi:hypothetical protein
MSLASAVSPGSTVAFESIDGPPPDVFRKLVADLNAEAARERSPWCRAESAATYRVRGYVSALVERDKTTFAWVWDVYDARQAPRLAAFPAKSRPPPASAATPGRPPTSRCFRRMARNGMDQMSGFPQLVRRPPPAVAPDRKFHHAGLGAATITTGREPGIDRLVRQPDQPTACATAEPAPANDAVPRGLKTKQAAGHTARGTNRRGLSRQDGRWRER